MFNVGDRAVVNNKFDPLVPAFRRDRVVGSYGSVSMIVDEDEGLVFFKPDVDVDTMPRDAVLGWAVLAEELDLLEAK